MKKLLCVVILIGLVASAKAASISITLPANTSTNLVRALNPPNGYTKITALSLVAPTATNVSMQAWDIPYVNPAGVTNSFTYTFGPYTNTVSYATNLVTSYTNYYGVATLLTNLVLIDNTNNVVSLTTNSYNMRFSASALANTTTTITPTSYTFEHGLLVTNTSTGTLTAVLTYQQ